MLQLLVILGFLNCVGCSWFGSSLKHSPSELLTEAEDENYLETDSISPVSLEIQSQGERRPFKKHFKKEDFLDHSESEGSLWASSGQTNYYFTKNKIRSAGDLIHWAMDQELYDSIKYEILKSLTFDEKNKELEHLKSNFMTNHHENEPLVASEDPVKHVNEKNVVSKDSKKTEQKKIEPHFDSADIDLSASLVLHVGDYLNGEVLERFPNGSCKIKAFKKVMYKNGLPRSVSILGLVKDSDINQDNDLIDSKNVYGITVKVTI